MLTALIVIFVMAYAAIALEHPLKINKSGSALVGAGLLWTIYALSVGDAHLVSEQLGESLMGTAQIVFFLMGAMTIVEVVDAHNGFDVITTRIKTSKLSTLMWLVGFVTFFLSVILDNLTTTIVMISLMRKLLAKHDDRLFFAGIIKGVPLGITAYVLRGQTVVAPPKVTAVDGLRTTVFERNLTVGTIGRVH
jgi:Na+/H+ antiporter NhaD/arsenite permease-like protein